MGTKKAEDKNRIKGFLVTTIKRCCICQKENTEGIADRVREYCTMMESSSMFEICSECFSQRTYQNSFGFTFLKWGTKLFCRKPDWYLDFNFEQVRSEAEIDRAFNPERYDFDVWYRHQKSGD
jgi:hypothetical protein